MAKFGAELSGLTRFASDAGEANGVSSIKSSDGDRVTANLSGVSETMLWSLHNRASETKRHDAVLYDPESVRIHDSIEYDYNANFGIPCGSLAARAAAIDDVLRRYLERHPDGCIVSLGEGLETQARRVDNGRMKWCSVDLPAAISLRERFLPATDRFRHVSASVVDPAWMDAVDDSSGVCIVAQGLLMYLEPDLVSRLFCSIARRFPCAEIVFDTIPRWFSELTMAGLNQTPRYRLPAMPWGINRDEIEPALRAWHPDVATVRFLDYRAPRGVARRIGDLTRRIAIARHGVPSLVHVTTVRSAETTRRENAG
jgi:O-methyltransferase involved in polyketide biosynthesis